MVEDWHANSFIRNRPDLEIMVVFWLFDCACFNAYLVYAHQPFDRHHQKVEHRERLLRLADELIAGKSFRSRLKKRKVQEQAAVGQKDYGHSQVGGQQRMMCATGCVAGQR